MFNIGGFGAIAAMKQSMEENRKLLGKRRRLKELYEERGLAEHAHAGQRKTYSKAAQEAYREKIKEKRKRENRGLLLLIMILFAVFFYLLVVMVS